MKRPASRARGSSWRVGTVIAGVAALGIGFVGTMADFGSTFGYGAAGLGVVLIVVAVVGRKPF